MGRPLAHALARPLTHSLAHSLTHSLAHALARPLTHPLTRSRTCSPTHSPTHLLTHSLAPLPTDIKAVGLLRNELAKSQAHVPKALRECAQAAFGTQVRGCSRRSGMMRHACKEG